MATAYQYDADGYFVGAVEDYGLLPNNATHIQPQEQDGHVPQWTDKAWELVENHKGREGYVDGKPFIVKAYGPLPFGWSDTPPEPTPEEEAHARMAEIDAEIKALEQKALRPLLAERMGIAEPYDAERLEEIMPQIIDLRCEMQLLEAIIGPEGLGVVK